MDNIRNVIKIFFCYTSPMEVLTRNSQFDKVQENTFLSLARCYMPQYSNNEVENMFHFLSTEFEWHNNKMRSREATGELRDVNVFDAVLLFADNVLVEENGMPLCRYENLLRWREMIVVLDEDLFITAFLAQKDLLCGKKRRNFFWPPVIGHNNKSLNRLMEQGVAENHFHMKGSAPLFHLSWLSMMNDVLFFKQVFDEYEEHRLHMKTAYHIKYTEHSLYILALQAALIRLYLFACLKDDYFTLRGDYIEYACVEPYLKQEYREKNGNSMRMVGLNSYHEWMFEQPEVYKALKKRLLRQDVEYFLNDIQELQFYLTQIQNGIEYMKETYSCGQLDYLLCEDFLRENRDRHLNEVISGERWFLYEIFKRIYSENNEFYSNANWFYAYILIKENIRAELIQANNNVGFHNFLLYQDRKSMFIDDTPFEKVYLKMAVRDTIFNQNIRKLEARFAPKMTADKFERSIKEYDDFILGDEEDGQELKNKFFYVCHFIKEKDENIQGVYRHYSKRLEVKEQAQALMEFRRKSPEQAQRIRGIDAASEEIVCRPEVFAQAFRYLKNQPVGEEDILEPPGKLPDLCVTYHVGEDFLDLIDGLRAIDEAVSFLNMRCGDRIGHALALGVDVEEWYKSKSGYILLSQMDYLDNLVWLYSKIRKYRIMGCEDTLHYIEKKYDEYFRVIYLNNMSGKYQEAVMEEAAVYFDRKGVQHNYRNSQCYFTLNTYYDSWKLRGDDPKYFSRGYFHLGRFERKSWEEWERYGINKEFPENYRIRYNPEAAYLFHTYHYNDAVKAEGDIRKEIKVNPCIIKAVKQVQKRMQWMIGQKGIGIETNPSSNALIGTFKRYDKHPILNWYNNGVATKPEEISGVPQIQVSINTDDQGVFATYIENEYAYLALALEKMKDENGRPRYSRELIYQWLDNIRKMGLAQSFERDADS